MSPTANLLKELGVEPPRTKAVTGHRTPKINAAPQPPAVSHRESRTLPAN